MNGYILKPARSQFTQNQLDALARTEKGRAKLEAVKHANMVRSDYNKQQAFHSSDVKGFDG